MSGLLYISNSRLPTEKAYGLQIGKMCEAFAAGGIEVTLLYPHRRGVIKENIFEHYNLKKNFKLKKIYSPDFYWPGKLDKAAFLIKSFIAAMILCGYASVKRPDIIYSRDELPVFILSFFRKNIFWEAHKFSGRRGYFYNRFRRAGIKIICISEGLASEFTERGFEKKQVMVAHDGVDLEEFNTRLSAPEARRKLNLPLEKKLIGYVGALTTMGAKKGLDELFEAFSLLSDTSVRLVLVGSSVNPAEVVFYKDLAKKLDIADRVIFAGQVAHKEVPAYLKAFDALAMPFPNTKHYATYMSPLKLFEYMASWRPIVATDLASIKYILNESNSVLVKPDDAKSLANGLSHVLANPAESGRLAAKAFEDVKKYTWANRARSILKFITVS